MCLLKARVEKGMRGPGPPDLVSRWAALRGGGPCRRKRPSSRPFFNELLFYLGCRYCMHTFAGEAVTKVLLFHLLLLHVVSSRRSVCQLPIATLL
jgi:hypothetical protein